VDHVPAAEPRSHCVINFYHLTEVERPGSLAQQHKQYIRSQGWDIKGRIYISYQGINAQYSGPTEQAIAYTEWLAEQPTFRGVTWRSYPVDRNMFPKLKLRFKRNLISLQGGMEGLPVVGAALVAPLHALPPPCILRIACMRYVSSAGQRRQAFAHPAKPGADETARATALPPSDWMAMLADAQRLGPELASSSADANAHHDSAADTQRPVLLDVRNSYEWDAGHFQGAQRPEEEEFRDTPRAHDPHEGVPAPLRGVDPATPVMARARANVSILSVLSCWLLRQSHATSMLETLAERRQ
jgi:rhodanese-related sulfurtransferase